MTTYVVRAEVSDLEVVLTVGRNGKFVDEVVLNPQDDWMEVIKWFVNVAVEVLRDAGADAEITVKEGIVIEGSGKGVIN